MAPYSRYPATGGLLLRLQGAFQPLTCPCSLHVCSVSTEQKRARSVGMHASSPRGEKVGEAVIHRAGRHRVLALNPLLGELKPGGDAHGELVLARLDWRRRGGVRSIGPGKCDWRLAASLFREHHEPAALG